MSPLTRKERASNVKKRNYFAKYSETARAVLDVILDKYADEGINNLDKEVLRIPDFREFGTPIQIAREFGGTNKFVLAMKELQQEIYTA